MKKILCLALVLLMTLPMVLSCGERGNEDDTVGQPSDTSTVINEDDRFERANELIAQIDTVNYDYSFKVLARDNVVRADKEIFWEAENGDPVGDAVYLRNNQVFEKTGATITLITRTDIVAAVREDQNTATHSYDLIMPNMLDATTMAMDNMLYNYNDLPVVNLEEEWWDPGTRTDSAINGNIYFMNGDINTVDNDVTWIMMFNKKLMNNLDMEEPYQLVRDRKWTLDRFTEMIRTFSSDNGDGIWDENDNYGFLTTDGGGVTNFMYSSGMKTVELDETGRPSIVMNSDKIIDLLSICKNIFKDDHYTYTVKDAAIGQQIFESDRALFYSEVMSYIMNLSNMETPFGVLPTPMYDEAQGRYYTHVDAIASTMCLPADMVDPERTGTILEAMAIYSYINVTPAYYDITLKRKQSRDEESLEMLDIILQSRVYDVGYLYSTVGLASLFNSLVNDGSTNFASAFQRKQRTASTELEKIYNRYVDKASE